ncbi:hypothetical protein RB195_022023 [Necator americanus]|uniref:RING-type domain-containing protein n=1 Tax=Necator americanus TaxID=51031 RepID=A0ABR1EDN0_NECAM
MLIALRWFVFSPCFFNAFLCWTCFTYVFGLLLVSEVHPALATSSLYKELTWTSFLEMIKELNRKCFNVRGEKGDYICFALDKSCADGLLWKKLARIKCFTGNSDSLQVIPSRVLNLDEFLNVYNVHKDAMQNIDPKEMSTSSCILNENADSEDLCCICMENSNEVLLPCLHSFCVVCVAQEMEFRPQFSCPICKARINRPLEDSWEVPDPPNPAEVVAYLSRLDAVCECYVDTLCKA